VSVAVNAPLPRFVRDLLSSPPHRSQGLNVWLYRVARVLHPYRPADEIVCLLRAVTAGEPVKHGEIERAVKRSRATAWRPSQPHNAAVIELPWPKVNEEQRAAVIASLGCGLVDLWETSSVRLESNEPRTCEIIEALFPSDALVCVGESNAQFATRPWNQFGKRLNEFQLIVPSPMTARIGITQDGKVSEHTLSNTSERRFLVIEFDSGTADDHAALLFHLAERAPLALALHSGGKSIHGWFYCVGQPEMRLRAFMRAAVTLGADRVTWTRSQFVRMPDGLRDNGKRQTVFFFNPEVVR
jgi:hypothetical protein